MIVALVAVETALLVVLVVLVAGLLRSHAELLRRVGPAEGGGGAEAPAGARAAADEPRPAGARAAADEPRPGGSAVRAGTRAAADEPRPGGAAPLAAPGAFREPRAAPVVGTTPTGDAVKLDFDGAAAQPTLLAFLSSGCGTCARFWQALGEREPPAGVRPVIVTRGGDRERPARLRTLAPAGVPVVMSSPAWQDYAVPGAPYFLLIDGEVRGEGVATTWEGLVSLVADAIEDARLIERSAAGPRRARRVDATLAAHGIGPGHPSLYPGRQAR